MAIPTILAPRTTTPLWLSAERKLFSNSSKPKGSLQTAWRSAALALHDPLIRTSHPKVAAAIDEWSSPSSTGSAASSLGFSDSSKGGVLFWLQLRTHQSGSIRIKSRDKSSQLVLTRGFFANLKAPVLDFFLHHLPQHLGIHPRAQQALAICADTSNDPTRRASQQPISPHLSLQAALSHRLRKGLTNQIIAAP